MTDQQNQKARFEPIHDAHAIEQVAFLLQIDRPIEEAKYAEVRSAAEKFKADLPGQSEIQGIKMSIGALGPVGSTPLGFSMGNVFSRTRADGIIESELRIDRMSATFRTLIYTRWDAVWAQARKYFDAIVPKYVAQARISGISLNFLDKFVWVGAPTECRPSLLLRPGSKYLCPHVYEAQDLWHSHTGSFSRADDQTKRLLSINVDYVDENPPEGLRRTVAITTVLTDLMNQPGYAALEVTENTVIEVLNAHMQQLHAFGKIAFGNIINDEMSKRIALIE